MRKIGIIAVLSLMVTALAAIPALAASPHFIGTPTFTDNGTTLTASGSIAGLGNENIDVLVTAQGIATVTCSNPGQNTDVPGQRATITATGSQTNLEVKNGRAFFNVTTLAPTTSGPFVDGQQVCPNSQWTATVTDVAFTSATITVFQPAGSQNVVLQQTFTL